jgi:ABC-type sugar transport system substrate-binding protein
MIDVYHGRVPVSSIDPNAAQAARAATKKPIVAGTVSPTLIDLLRAGTVDALIYQNPILQCYYAV